MKKNNYSLHFKVWFNLIIFSLIVIILIWFFQIFSLNYFYEYTKTKELDSLVNKIDKHYSDDNFYDYLKELSFKNDICIELYNNNELEYNLGSNIQCLPEHEETIDYKDNFILSNKNSEKYTISNMKDKKTIVYAKKIKDNVYLYASVNLKPLDATTSTLQKQLRYVAFIVLILSFIVSYIISKLLSKPIENINGFAKELGKGNYDAKLDDDSDIKEIQELTETLNYTKDTLAKTDSIRKELMANVSHDLKTPLTMIKAYAEMARDLNSNNELKRKDNLNVIIEESDRLNLLVNDILDLTKIESESEKLKLEKADLDKIIKTIIKRYDIYKEQGYKIEYVGIKNSTVLIDIKRIEQVLYNLINNAINYTGEDKKVTIKLISIKNKYRVEVIDTGKGIDKKELKLIWDKYYKSDKTHSRLYLGTGIGLSIVKNILIKHNFEYGVESKKNKGTMFYFEIPK